MRKGLLVFLAVLLAVPIAHAATVCSSGCDYPNITACLDAVNSTYNGQCSLNDANAVYTVTGAGVYNITGDTSRSRIVFGANNVTLDCNGATLYTGRSPQCAISVQGRNYPTIKNCVIDGTFYFYGIHMDTVTGGKVFNNTVTNLAASTDAGIILYRARNVHIIDNNLTTTSQYGNIYLSTDCDNNTVANNTIADGKYGIVVSDAYNNTLENNSINSMVNYGIQLTNSAAENLMLNNSITSCGSRGIVLEGSPSNTIQDNYFNANYYHIYSILSSSYNVIDGNYFTNTTNSYAIGIEGTPVGINITNNDIVSNNHGGIYLEAGVTGTRVKGNTIENNSNYGVYLTGNSKNTLITGNTIKQTSGGVYIASGVNNNTITQNTITDSNYWGVSISSNNNTVTGNNISSNGGIAYNYVSSNYPREWNGVDWDVGSATYYLFNSNPYLASVTADDTALDSVVVDGTYDLNLALYNQTSAATTIFNDSVATNCAELVTWAAGIGVAITCNYFEPDVWQNNGAGSSYTANFNASTTTVSGYSVPSLEYEIDTSSTTGGIYISSGSDNTLSSNTLSSNGVGIRIASSGNTISGNTINANNNLSLYIPSNVDVTIDSLTFPSPVADFGLSKAGGKLDVSNSYGKIEWTAQNINLNKNYGSHLYVGDKFVSLDPDQLSELDTKANVSLYHINCREFDLYHYSGFTSNYSLIMSEGVKVADESNVGGDCDNTSICKNVRCSGGINGVLLFEAQHFDGFGGEGDDASTDSGNVSINLTEEISVFVRFNVDFGSGRVVGSNDSAELDSDAGTCTNGTWSFGPQHLLVKNDGTVNLSVNVTSDKSASSFIGGVGAEFQVKGKVTESGACAGTLQTDYFEVSTSSENICSNLRFGVSFDQFNVSTRLLIPSDAEAGVKDAILTFTATKN